MTQLSCWRQANFLARIAILCILLGTAVTVQGQFPDIPTAWDFVEPNPARFDNKAFDYVIVGGGIAGCVLAARLVENNNYTVLLLERGAVPPKQQQVLNLAPAQTGWVTQNHYFVENLYSEPVPTTPLNQGIDATQGTGLGGGSNHNHGIWSRPLYSELDAWNISGWSGADLKPYFKKSESSVLAAVDPDNHGSSGPISVELPGGIATLHAPVLAAAASLGIPAPVSLSDGLNNEGLAQAHGAFKHGRRQPACDAYLLSLARTGRLYIFADAAVSKLEISKSGNLVTYIKVMVGNDLIAVRARREVILSAGTIGTPKILMLSGIGDRDHLTELGIPVKAHLPAVGAGMVARPMATVVWSGVPGPIPEKDIGALLNPASFGEFLQYGTGAWAYPDFGVEGVLRPAPGLEVLAQVTRPHEQMMETPLSTIVGSCINSRPNSRGQVRLRSSSFYHTPRVLGNLTADPTDLGALIACIRTLRQVMATPPAAYVAGMELAPGATLQSDQELAFYIQNSPHLWSYHAYGTCRMGNQDDTSSVVGPDLKVRGFRNLRVVDGSIIPGPTSGGMMALIYGIAEKAAATILAAKY